MEVIRTQECPAGLDGYVDHLGGAQQGKQAGLQRLAAVCLSGASGRAVAASNCRAWDKMEAKQRRGRLLAAVGPGQGSPMSLVPDPCPAIHSN